jgi:hypothetical protein
MLKSGAAASTLIYRDIRSIASASSAPRRKQMTATAGLIHVRNSSDAVGRADSGKLCPASL